MEGGGGMGCYFMRCITNSKLTCPSSLAANAHTPAAAANDASLSASPNSLVHPRTRFWKNSWVWDSTSVYAPLMTRCMATAVSRVTCEGKHQLPALSNSNVD